MTRETILVVSDSGMELFSEVLEGTGCGVIKTSSDGAARSVRRFIGEFSQGIPVAIVCGQEPDQASILAGQLKGVCEGMRVIAVSDRVGHATKDAGRDYDVIIPPNSGDLRDMLDTFLGCND